MKTQRTENTITVVFSADEAEAAGLPKRGLFIRYKNGLLDDFSCWLFKQCSFEAGIDKLQEIADKEVGYACR